MNPHNIVELDGEWCGDSLEIFAQCQLFKSRHQLASNGGLVSQGRSLMVMNHNKLSRSQIVRFIREFRRVLIFGEQDGLESLGQWLRTEHISVEDDLMSVLVSSANTITARLRSIEDGTSLPPEWHFSELQPTSPAETVAAVQALQISSGMTPMPGWFLRGFEGGKHTVLLCTDTGKVVGCATAVDLSPGSASLSPEMM